jgi:hypothetical protein
VEPADVHALAVQGRHRWKSGQAISLHAEVPGGAEELHQRNSAQQGQEQEGAHQATNQAAVRFAYTAF